MTITTAASAERTRILIVGGGYVGMYTALRLQKKLRRELKDKRVEIVKKMQEQLFQESDFISAHYGRGREAVCDNYIDPTTGGTNGMPICP